MTKKTGKMGVWMLTTLVAGNMIGSGIFLLPSSLASIGGISLLSWCFTAVGAFLLAIVFSKMSILVPKTGGPYAFAREGFGNFVGFQTAYSYWIALWVGNAAIVVAMVGYLAVFWPVLIKPTAVLICSLAVVWLLTLVNIRGVRSAGFMQVVTTALKFIPLLLISILGWRYFHPEYITQSFNVTSHSNLSALSHAASLTLWAFIGVESASVPAQSVDNPGRNIPLATLLGTLMATVVYIASSAVIMGMIPVSILASTTSPFAAAAKIIFGNWGGWFIAAGAAISTFGCLNGWILLQGQVAMAAAADGLFPKIFAKRNKADVPAWGLVITAILISILLLMTSNPNLVTQFQEIILTATFASLVPYLYTAVAEIIVCRQLSQKASKRKTHMVIALMAGLYSFWAIIGVGSEVLFYGSILLFTSIPLYAVVNKNR